MKILFINNWIHDKNLKAIQLYKNIQLTFINSSDMPRYDLSQYDAVYSPSEPIHVSQYPNTKFLFGPHFSVLPDNRLQIIKGPNSIYTQLCDWNVKVWESFDVCNGLTILPIPFGVDTEKFRPIKELKERDKVFIYFKARHPSLLQIVELYLQKRNINYVIFNYRARYEEADYINYLQQSKYGIWVGSHESQGFGLEECLSMNVPLLVWNVETMNQEYGYNNNYAPYPASSIPYWDNTCGEYFYNECDLERTYELFISKIDTYTPRKYIVEHVSIDVCEKKMIVSINNIKL